MWLDRQWRRVATAFCFLVYGGLAWLASFTVLPVLTAMPGSADVRARRARGFAGWSFRTLLGMIAVLRVGHVEIDGRERLAAASGKLLLATHPMYLDVVALVGALPEVDCVAKADTWRSPFYRRFVAAMDYVSNADGAAMVSACSARLRDGRCLLMFPEGTRSDPAVPLRFHRGAAQIAIESRCEILPVIIDCQPRALGRGQAWHDVGERPWRLSIRVCRPVPLAALGYRESLPRGAAARHVTRALEELFAQLMADHEYPDRRLEAAHHQYARS